MLFRSDGGAAREEEGGVYDDGGAAGEEEEGMYDDGGAAGEEEEGVYDDGGAAVEEEEGLYEDGGGAREEEGAVVAINMMMMWQEMVQHFSCSVMDELLRCGVALVTLFDLFRSITST